MFDNDSEYYLGTGVLAWARGNGSVYDEDGNRVAADAKRERERFGRPTHDERGNRVWPKVRENMRADEVSGNNEPKNEVDLNGVDRQEAEPYTTEERGLQKIRERGNWGHRQEANAAASESQDDQVADAYVSGLSARRRASHEAGRKAIKDYFKDLDNEKPLSVSETVRPWEREYDGEPVDMTPGYDEPGSLGEVRKNPPKEIEVRPVSDEDVVARRREIEFNKGEAARPDQRPPLRVKATSG